MEKVLHTSAGDRSRGRLARLLALALAGSGGLAPAAGDPYLEMLDREVAKVEVAPTDNSSGTPVAASAAETDGSREQFEARLRSEHVGTYSFYRRLPERSREEMYLEYRSGVPMTGLREKIVQRFLNQ
jgi:hypothetical protein